MPDVLAPTAPATSAVSDMPVIDPANALPAEAVDETPKPDQSTSTGEAPVEADTPPNGESQEGVEGKVLTPSQRAAFTRERNKRAAAERENAELRDQLKQALAGIAKLTEKPAPQRPRREDFTDPDAYERAIEAHAAAQATEKAKAEAQAEIERQARERQFEQVRGSYQERAEAFAEDHPDYFDVVDADDAGFTLPMTMAILETEDGPQVAYHLARNPAELKRLAGLTPARTVYEIGKLAAKLTSTEKPAPRLPDPVRPLGGRSAAPLSDEEPSMEAYGERRLAELRKAQAH